MATAAETRRTWMSALRAEAKARKHRFIGGYAYSDDGPHVVSVAALVGSGGDQVGVNWWVDAKPQALDDLLWSVFLPDLEASPAKRRSLRVNGAFQAPALKLGEGKHSVSADEDPAETVNLILDEFEQLRDAFIEEVPGDADFIAAVRRHTAGGRTPTGQDILREVLALILAGDDATATEILENEIAQGNFSPMRGPNGGVFDLFLDYLKDRN